MNKGGGREGVGSRLEEVQIRRRGDEFKKMNEEEPRRRRKATFQKGNLKE